MKHVIVIETVDLPRGGKGIYPELKEFIESMIESAIFNSNRETCLVYSRFNVPSALAALHELYGVPNCQHPEGV